MNKEKHWIKNENGEYECKICHKISTKSGIGNHVKYHFGYKNPMCNETKVPWNKGLSKETSYSLRKAAETAKKNIESGKVIPSFTGRKHSDETRRKWKENPNMGGLREGSGHGIKGWYKQYYCRSTWELAWLVYQLEHNEQVIQCHDYFVYEFDGKNHRYYPDFIINNIYYEIKGFRIKNVEAKIAQFPKDKKLILIEGKQEIKPFIDYCSSKYGKLFWEKLYDCERECC